MSGRTPSCDAFVRDSQVALVRYAMLLCGSVVLAEDLVQDVLIKVYLRWDRILAGDGDVHAYVRRAVTNEFLSWRRRWSTRHIRLVDAETLNAVSIDPWTGTHDDELWQRLMQLPGQQRAAVVLRYYEDLDDAEIADTLGCRPGTVRGHISRGLAALRQASGTDVSNVERRPPDA
ncbi:MAG: SigE family RNA polymerase sigma factor [Jatrophihabitans sp.]|uniref:SigE family RNA polymerase sigma factor n=1 Tax=Jatrophihabitans sp. TaxID=1932789 RepID=UPI0039168C03